MAIDILTDTINIKELTLKEPVKKPELPFDPEKELTDGLWESVKYELRDEFNFASGSMETYCHLAANALTLFPDRRSELFIPGLQRLLLDPEGLNASDIKIIYPGEPTQNIVAKKYTPSFELIKTHTGRNRDDFGYWISTNSAPMIMDAFILYNSQFAELKSVDGLPEMFQKVAEHKKESHNWPDFIRYKLLMKLFDVDPGITSDEWDGMIGDFRKQSNLNLKLEMVAKMKMLTADKIEMTDRGLRLIMPDQGIDTEPDNPFPERRKF
jgi:hypothetical protein